MPGRRATSKPAREVTNRFERLRARLTHGHQSREVVPLSATGQLGMAAPGQIQLTVVTLGVRVDGRADLASARYALG